MFQNKHVIWSKTCGQVVQALFLRCQPPLAHGVEDPDGGVDEEGLLEFAEANGLDVENGSLMAVVRRAFLHRPFAKPWLGESWCFAA